MHARMLGLLLLLVTGAAACMPAPRPSFRLIAGSGFSTYEPLLKRFAARHDVNLEITYRGSLDIMRMLEDGSIGYDGIWEADSLWTSLGDKQLLLRQELPLIEGHLMGHG